MQIAIARVLCLTLLFGIAGNACVVQRIVEVWGKQPGLGAALFPFLRDGKVGFIDALGNIVVEPKLDTRLQDLEDFSEGLAAVNWGPRTGFIDENGAWRIEGDYQSVSSFSEGLARASRRLGVFPWSETVYLDKAGTVVFSLGKQRGHDFHGGLAAFESEGRPRIRNFSPGKVYRDFPGLMGYIDRSGRVVIEPKFAEAGPFSDGLARVVLDGYCYRLLPDGSKLGSPTSGFPNSFGYAPEDAEEVCTVGFIDMGGVFKIRPVLESARDFNDGLAAARLGGKWGFLDRKGDWVIKPHFEEAWSFNEGLAAVKQDGRWGYIDRAGSFRIAPKYSWVSRFNEGIAFVLDGDQSAYIDKTGAETMVGDYRYRTFFAQGLAAVRLDSKSVAYINRAGEVVFRYEAKRGQ